ncbi:uncharacterized protein METZ01_LOCUS291417, partial [marine metagenome]
MKSYAQKLRDIIDSKEIIKIGGAFDAM